MHTNDYECDLFRDLAFFADENGFSGIPMRPLSLCSRKIMQEMKLKLLDEDPQLTLEEESQQVAVYIWLHTAAIADICEAMWDGTWKIVQERAVPMPQVVEEFRAWKIRLIMILKACEIFIREKPAVPGDRTPKDLYYPTNLAATISQVVAVSGKDSDHVKWHMFLGEALQYRHVWLRWQGVWTARKVEEVSIEECENIAPDWLPVPPDLDTAQPA